MDSRRFLIRPIFQVFSVLLSGWLLYLAFPPFALSFAAWFALVPLLVFLRTSRPAWAFSGAFLSGFVFTFLYVYWLTFADGFPWLGLFSIALYTAFFFGIFGILFSFTSLKLPRTVFLFSAFLWVSVEYLRSNLSFLSIPLGLVGFSQHGNLPLLQLASIASVYGISFLVLMVNAILAEGVILLFHCREVPGKNRGRQLSGMAIVSVFLLGSVYFWGSLRIQSTEERAMDLMKVSIIQPNIPQEEKWDPAHKTDILETYREMTMEASREKPDLIIWPEASTPGYLKRDLEISGTVINLLDLTGIPLLLGSSSHAKINRDGQKKWRLKNSAFLMVQSDHIAGEYNKTILLPFAEYVPMEEKVPWPAWMVPEKGYFIPGTERSVFTLPKGEFGVVICWENLFSEHIRGFVKNGAEFMVNLTNEAWFKNSAGSRNLLSISVFRAVENGMTLVRAANTGISAIIGPTGRILGQVEGEKGDSVMVRGILTVNVPGPASQTFYTLHGDIFAKMCSGVSAVVVVSALLNFWTRKKDSTERCKSRL